MYQPAPLDEISAVNRVLQIDHPLITLVTFEESYTVLHWLERYYGFELETKMWDLATAVAALKRDKAAGAPYGYIYGPTKGAVLDNVAIDELLDNFLGKDQHSEGTLKDELRIIIEGIMKDARLFTPSNIQTVLVGALLFGAQNEALAKAHNYKAIKIGLQVPGGEMAHFWNAFRKFGGFYMQFDGVQNDSHFAPWAAWICKTFRKGHLPREFHKLVDRYYSQVYHGWVSILGVATQFFMNTSGQFNTAADNSIGYLALLMLHAIRCGYTYDEFVTKLRIAIMGDDMLIASHLELFRPLEIEKTFNSVGMYLECPSVESQDFFDLMFCGCRPVLREIDGASYLLYVGRIDRARCAFNYYFKNASVEDRIDRLIGLTITMFGDQDTYEEMRSITFEQAKALNCNREALVLLKDQTLLNLYLDLQSFGNSFIFSVAGQKDKGPIKETFYERTPGKEMAEFMGKLVTSGQARGMLRKAVVAGKKMRTNRIKAGRRVLMPGLSGYNRGWIKRRGGNRSRSNPGNLVVKNRPMPVANNTSLAAVVPKTRILTGCDVTNDVTIDQLNTAPGSIALYPTNSVLFNKLAADSASYQYYRFIAINVVYVPNCGSSTNGTICMAACADSDAAAEITTYPQLTMMNKKVQTPFREQKTLNIEASDLGTSRKVWSIRPDAKTDESEPDTVQGYMVWGQTGQDAADAGKKVGNLYVGYRVIVSNVKDPDLTDPPGVTSADHGADAAGNVIDLVTSHALLDRIHQRTTLSTPAASTLRVTFNKLGYYLVHVKVQSTGVNNPTLTPALTNCTEYKSIQKGGTTQSYDYNVILHATQAGGYVNLLQANNAQYAFATVLHLRTWEAADALAATF